MRASSVLETCILFSRDTFLKLVFLVSESTIALLYVSDNTLIVFLMVAETKKRKRVDEEASGGRRAKTRRGQGGECVYITMTKWKNMCVGEKQ